MGDYTPPPESAPAAVASCETGQDDDLTAAVDADVPVAYDREVGLDVCLDVNLSDPAVDLDALTSVT